MSLKLTSLLDDLWEHFQKHFDKIKTGSGNFLSLRRERKSCITKQPLCKLNLNLLLGILRQTDEIGVNRREL